MDYVQSWVFGACSRLAFGGLSCWEACSRFCSPEWVVSDFCGNYGSFLTWDNPFQTGAEGRGRRLMGCVQSPELGDTLLVVSILDMIAICIRFCSPEGVTEVVQRKNYIKNWRMFKEIKPCSVNKVSYIYQTVMSMILCQWYIWFTMILSQPSLK